jgi:hypothetical protein
LLPSRGRRRTRGRSFPRAQSSAPRARAADVQGEMGRGDDDRHPAGDVIEDSAHFCSRSLSVSTNCSDQLARVQMPADPESIMKSVARPCPSRSTLPASSKMVSAIGNTPRREGQRLPAPSYILREPSSAPILKTRRVEGDCRQWLSRGTGEPVLPTKKSKSAPRSAWRTWST